ncbi:hypothetical protein [Dyadobacter sp. MSC1_007]|jgi:hypothetical protein|uniref:hypothetical protein n=1 Tax=Dyadobacter sp. MSC1_007 TaxID=2909264 RepID=UPI00202E47C7|nr:hypothetical protein [Dyadobacter sp. MSC1_007]
MLQTITIDVINDKALDLLRDLEHLNLIRLREDTPSKTKNTRRNYKGAMTQQPVSEIESQIRELRDEWS